jgi:hypothetical protein
MKTMTASLVVVLACVLLVPASLQASSAGDPAASLTSAENLSRLSVGVGWDADQRPVTTGSAAPDGRLESNSLYGWAGLDLCAWMTIKGGYGVTEAKEMPYGDYGDSENMWVLGVVANLWEHKITQPSYAASVLRLRASYMHWDHEAGVGDGLMSWEEDRLSLVFAAEFIVQHALDNAENMPFSTVFTIGPTLSRIDGDSSSSASIAVPGDGDVSFEETEDVGLLIGIDLKLAPNLSVGWEGRLIDGDMSHTVAAAFHF